MDKHRRSKVTPALEASILKTSLGTVLGTVALVSIHHRYRKQRLPEAQLQDYLTGLDSQLRMSIQSLSAKAPADYLAQFRRLQYAYQQATCAYQNYDKSELIQPSQHTRYSSEIQTTTLLTHPVSWVSGVSSMPQAQAVASDKGSCCGVVGIDAERQIVWQTTMPERVHDIVIQPVVKASDTANTDIDIDSISATTINQANNNSSSRDVVVMGRRPSESFWLLDTATGQVKQAIKAAANRHFYGHACYSLDGTQLYVTENDTLTLNGKIGVYDANNNYKKTAEFDSYGIGPHELIMHPDSQTLIIANGGIKTEQASREELNLDSMQPSLVYINRHDGTLLQQIVPEHQQMSIRHLAMHDDGSVMIGIQFQGEKHINVPLVLTHQRGDAQFKPLTMPNNQWQRFHQYIASLAVDSKNNLLCVTTPIGGYAAIYDLTTRKLIDGVRLLDCAGASLVSGSALSNGVMTSVADLDSRASANHEADINKWCSGFIVSDGQGQLTTLSVSAAYADEAINTKLARPILIDSQLHKMAFDNHLQAL